MKTTFFPIVAFLLLLASFSSCSKPETIECNEAVLCIKNNDPELAVIYSWAHQTDNDTLMPGECALDTSYDIRVEFDRNGNVTASTTSIVTFQTPGASYAYEITDCYTEIPAPGGFYDLTQYCDNGEYNPESGETDVDCGGFCAPCGAPNLPCNLSDDYLDWDISGILGGDLNYTTIDTGVSTIRMNFSFNYSSLKATFHLTTLPNTTTRYDIGGTDNKVQLSYTASSSFSTYHCNQPEGYLYLVKEPNGEYSLKFCNLNFTDGNYDFKGSANLSINK